jgi:hypothetical protein
MKRIIKGLFQLISILTIGMFTLFYTSELFNNISFQTFYCIITGLIIIWNFEKIFGEFAIHAVSEGGEK